ncbi:MAG: SpvB/TcaC N-terminal domain-containing protein [Arenicella sp.]
MSCVRFFWVAFVFCFLGFVHNAFAQSVPGATSPSYSTSPGGQFRYSIPIVVSPGTNGVAPKLSLEFSSGSGNGNLGVGWSLFGLPSIYRCGRTLAIDGIKGGVNHGLNDRYCFNGKRLIAVNGIYGADGTEYRTELDEFSKIISYGSGSVNVNGGTAPSYWRVFRKDGSHQFYGNTVGSHYFLPGTFSIHSWKLGQSYDRSGNFFEVQYQASEGLPSRIDYTKNNENGLASDKAVTFAYETRTDVRSRYVAGVRIDKQYRLKNINVIDKGVTFRQYKLAYDYGTTSKRSRITSVTECGLNNTCMPAINVAWKTDSAGFRTAANAGEKPNAYMMRTDLLGSDREEMTLGQWADVNGDGRADHVRAYVDKSGTLVRNTWLKTDTGWLHSVPYKLPTAIRNYDEDLNMAKNVMNTGQFIDVNGDNLVDWVVSYYYYNSTTHQNEWVKETWLNTGSGWQQSTAFVAPDPIYDYRSNYFNKETIRGRFIDVNGDGLVDWVVATMGI